jgi:phosphatidate phosphatase APP1
MSNWKNILKKISQNVEESFDNLKNDFKRRLGRQRAIMLLPYRGFSNGKRIYLRGRVLEDRQISQAEDNDTVWENLLNTYKRLNSNEIAGAKILAHKGNWQKELSTDAEGYFLLDEEVNDSELFDNQQVWQTIQFKLLSVPHREIEVIEAEGQVQKALSEAEYGIISDVDDTILQTGATSLLKMAKLTFLHNAKTRLPFAGVAAFYQALQKGKNPNAANPIFYVSSSPWNLYDLLTDFCEIQQIPLGTFFLRDYGLDAEKELPTDHHDHKLSQIAKVMAMYPSLSFILIGDNGQHDPEIYLEALKKYPNRVKAIYIRDVASDKRDAEVQEIILKAQKLGVEMLLVPDTYSAAHHAVSMGFISSEALTKIEQENEADKTRKSDWEEDL